MRATVYIILDRLYYGKKRDDLRHSEWHDRQ